MLYCAHWRPFEQDAPSFAVCLMFALTLATVSVAVVGSIDARVGDITVMDHSRHFAKVRCRGAGRLAESCKGEVARREADREDDWPTTNRSHRVTGCVIRQQIIEQQL